MFLIVLLSISIPICHSQQPDEIPTIPADHGRPYIELAERAIHAIKIHDFIEIPKLFSQSFYFLNAQNQREHWNHEMEILFEAIHNPTSIIIERVCDGRIRGNRTNKQEKEFDIKSNLPGFKLLASLQNGSYQFFAMKNETGRAQDRRCYQNTERRNLAVTI